MNQFFSIDTNLLRFRVRLSSLQELHLCGGHVLRFPEPRLEAGLLKGPAVREGEAPRLRALEAVHGVERIGGLLLRHAAREEGHARHGGRHAAAERGHRGRRDVWERGGVLAGLAAPHHVGLQQRALEQDVMVAQGLVARRNDLLRDSRRELDGVGAVHEHLGLNDRHEAVVLANGCVPRERVCVLHYGQWGGRGTRHVVDVQNSAPLCETGTSIS